MIKIEEVIIVEGVHDIAHLKTFINADFVETGGSSLPKSTQEFLLQLKSEGRNFIILTDPDFPGEKIRKQLLELLPDAKQAFVRKEKARTAKKVGVEHASKEEILSALENCVTYSEKSDLISWSEYIDLGVSGKKNSAYLRKRLGDELHIGEANSKTFFSRLNMLNIDKDKLMALIEEINHG